MMKAVKPFSIYVGMAEARAAEAQARAAAEERIRQLEAELQRRRP